MVDRSLIDPCCVRLTRSVGSIVILEYRIPDLKMRFSSEFTFFPSVRRRLLKTSQSSQLFFLSYVRHMSPTHVSAASRFFNLFFFKRPSSVTFYVEWSTLKGNCVYHSIFIWWAPLSTNDDRLVLFLMIRLRRLARYTHWGIFRSYAHVHGIHLTFV